MSDRTTIIDGSQIKDRSVTVDELDATAITADYFARVQGDGSVAWQDLFGATNNWTGNNTYNTRKLRFRNPADTFSYIVNTSAITASRSITLPLLTQNDTFVFAKFNNIFLGNNIVREGYFSFIKQSLRLNPTDSTTVFQSLSADESISISQKFQLPDVNTTALQTIVVLDFVQTFSVSQTFSEGINLNGDLSMNDNNIVSVNTITFNDINGTIAGIENQNLLDRTANENITGRYTIDSGDTTNFALTLDTTVGVGQVKWADFKLNGTTVGTIEYALGVFFGFIGVSSIFFGTNSLNFLLFGATGAATFTATGGCITNTTFQFIGGGIQMNDLRIDFNTGLTSSIRSISNNLTFEIGGVDANIFTATETVFNETQIDTDFRVESNDRSHSIYLDAGNNRIGINRNTSTLSATLDVEQESLTGATPVLQLDQSDISEEFIKLIGSAGSGILTQSIVAEADVTTATRQGFIKISVQDDGNQITDQSYYLPIFTLS